MSRQRMIGILLLTAWLVPALVCTGPARAQVENLTQVIDVAALGEVNDAYEDGSGVVSYAVAGGLPLGGTSGIVGARFMGLNIPKGAATLQSSKASISRSWFKPSSIARDGTPATIWFSP
jgi:hypothetical protein